MSESTTEDIGSTGEVVEQLRHSFVDEEYRNAYAESFLNSFVAAQIKVLREAYPLTQAELAERIGSKQPGIARLENVNYSAWKVETLRKLARALGVRLKITFEEWGTLPEELESFNREHLTRVPFERDPVFSPAMPQLGRIQRDDDIMARGFQPRPEHRLIDINDIPRDWEHGGGLGGGAAQQAAGY